MKVKIGPFPKKGLGRKINVEVNGYDTWNMDHTLAHIIYPCLLQLKATKQGIPNDFVNDVGGEDYVDQSSFDFYTESHKEAWDIAAARWDEVLDKMIWSFEQLLKNEYDEKYHHGKPEFDFVETQKLFPNPISGKMEVTYQMVDKNPGEHWYDAEGHQLHEERIQEGLELFGKYFRALWD